MSLEGVVAIAAGAVTVIGAVIAVTRHIVGLQRDIKEERIRAERDAFQQQLRDLESRHEHVVNEMAMAVRVGTAALASKHEVDAALLSLMKTMQAEAGSVYIPLPSTPPQASPPGLVFLSIQPMNESSLALQKKTVPMRSLAGRCFSSGMPLARPDAKHDSDHYGPADAVSGYETHDVLSVPLKAGDRAIGVVQLLNRMGGRRFSEADISSVVALCEDLTRKVAKFTANPENLQLLGVASGAGGEEATVLFCDLTRSSLLFRELDAASAIRHINEFFEALCEIAIDDGATVDKYMGDGVLLRFNVPRRLEDHTHVAVRTALSMRDAFEVLKSSWLTLGELLAGVHLRAGVALGRVHHAAIGHPHRQDLTILGPPVSVAVNLCEFAPRDRSIIVIDEFVARRLQDRIVTEELSDVVLGKAKAFVQRVYELKGLT